MLLLLFWWSWLCLHLLLLFLELFMLSLLFNELLLFLLLEGQLPDKVFLVWYVHIIGSTPCGVCDITLLVKRSSHLCQWRCCSAQWRGLHNPCRRRGRRLVPPLQPHKRVEQNSSSIHCSANTNSCSNSPVPWVHPTALGDDLLHSALPVSLCAQKLLW